jgi:hypothetical protein
MRGHGEEPLHGFVDMEPKGSDLFGCWTSYQSAVRTRVARPGGYVIGIEKIAESFVENFVAWQVRNE